MGVVVRVEYCGGCGYRPKYEKLKDYLKKTVFGVVEYTSYASPQLTGKFEVFVNGYLVHSKKNGDGFVDSDIKRNKISQAIRDALEK